MLNKKKRLRKGDWDEDLFYYSRPLKKGHKNVEGNKIKTETLRKKILTENVDIIDEIPVKKDKKEKEEETEIEENIINSYVTRLDDFLAEDISLNVKKKEITIPTEISDLNLVTETDNKYVFLFYATDMPQFNFLYTIKDKQIYYAKNLNLTFSDFFGNPLYNNLFKDIFDVSDKNISYVYFKLQTYEIEIDFYSKIIKIFRLNSSSIFDFNFLNEKITKIEVTMETYNLLSFYNHINTFFKHSKIVELANYTNGLKAKYFTFENKKEEKEEPIKFTFSNNPREIKHNIYEDENVIYSEKARLWVYYVNDIYQLSKINMEKFGFLLDDIFGIASNKNMLDANFTFPTQYFISNEYNELARTKASLLNYYNHLKADIYNFEYNINDDAFFSKINYFLCNSHHNSHFGMAAVNYNMHISDEFNEQDYVDNMNINNYNFEFIWTRTFNIFHISQPFTNQIFKNVVYDHPLKEMIAISIANIIRADSKNYYFKENAKVDTNNEWFVNGKLEAKFFNGYINEIFSPMASPIIPEQKPNPSLDEILESLALTFIQNAPRIIYGASTDSSDIMKILCKSKLYGKQYGLIPLIIGNENEISMNMMPFSDTKDTLFLTFFTKPKTIEPKYFIQNNAKKTASYDDFKKNKSNFIKYPVGIINDFIIQKNVVYEKINVYMFYASPKILEVKYNLYADLFPFFTRATPLNSINYHISNEYTRKLNILPLNLNEIEFTDITKMKKQDMSSKDPAWDKNVVLENCVYSYNCFWLKNFINRHPEKKIDFGGYDKNNVSIVAGCDLTNAFFLRSVNTQSSIQKIIFNSSIFYHPNDVNVIKEDFFNDIECTINEKNTNLEFDVSKLNFRNVKSREVGLFIYLGFFIKFAFLKLKDIKYLNKKLLKSYENFKFPDLLQIYSQHKVEGEAYEHYLTLNHFPNLKITRVTTLHLGNFNNGDAFVIIIRSKINEILDQEGANNNLPLYLFLVKIKGEVYYGFVNDALAYDPFLSVPKFFRYTRDWFENNVSEYTIKNNDLYKNNVEILKFNFFDRSETSVPVKSLFFNQTELLDEFKDIKKEEDKIEKLDEHFILCNDKCPYFHLSLLLYPRINYFSRTSFGTIPESVIVDKIINSAFDEPD